MTTPETCFHGNQPPCQECADEEYQFRRMRHRAASLVPAAEEGLRALGRLTAQLAEAVGCYPYEEFYEDVAADADALADLKDAQRALRSFARIAREREARTGQMS